jgi:protein-S-isoprenylcysteine O-methyltransferase Ste14
VAIQAVLLMAIAVGGLMEPPMADGGGAVALRIVGVVLLVTGGTLAVLGVRDLGRSLTALPRPVDSGQLVTSGVYRLVRHPIYGGLVIAALGFGLALCALIAGVSGSIALLLLYTLKSIREEVWLTARYLGYAAYRARTRRMLPLIW